MAKLDPKDPAPTFIEVLDLAERRGAAGTSRPSATRTLAQLLARAHRENDAGRRPILVKLPPKAPQ